MKNKGEGKEGARLTPFTAYLEGLETVRQRAVLGEVLRWVGEKFPDLTPKIAWNQPMFTDHGTFIIGFSAAKAHLAVAPERAGILRFSGAIERAGYRHSKELIRIPWGQAVDFALLEEIIRFNVEDKRDCTAFWRG